MLDSRLHNVAETKCDGSLISAAVKCRNADRITTTTIIITIIIIIIIIVSSSSSSSSVRYYATCYRA